METDSNPIHSLLTNLTTNQKIGFGLGIVIIVLIIVLAPTMLQGLFVNNTATDEPVTETYTDEQGNTVTVETYTNDQGEEVVTGTREDPYGNITTINPDLITTYFPYQVMRDHADGDPTLRYYLAIDEASGLIRVIMEDCDVENDKILIQQYINSIPFDLSGYKIEYELSSVDTSCDD